MSKIPKPLPEDDPEDESGLDLPVNPDDGGGGLIPDDDDRVVNVPS